MSRKPVWTVTRTWEVQARTAPEALVMSREHPGGHTVEVRRDGGSLKPDWVVAPGHILREWCEENDVWQSELARRAGVSRSQISDIMLGRRAYTPTMCVKLAEVTGMSAQFLWRLQADWVIGKVMGKKEL